MRTAIPHNSRALHGMLCARRFALLALVVATLCGAPSVAAQTQATAASTHRTAHPRKRPVVATPQPPALVAAPVPVMPPAPEVPAWPANEKAAKATIIWDSRGLRIDAANSSLAQILVDVDTVTGATVVGFDADQRVFGVYGPGPARDVLGQLLQGTGYNVMMIGDLGQGTPRKIVLSPRHGGTTPAVTSAAPANNDEDADTEDQPQPQMPQPMRPAFGPGGPPRTPQQMQQFQQMQQRQQQMLQQRPPQN